MRAFLPDHRAEFERERALYYVSKKKGDLRFELKRKVVNVKRNNYGISPLNKPKFTSLHKRLLLPEYQNCQINTEQEESDYNFEFPQDSLYVPLQSYQVGQLVRKIFPNIGRCKVSLNGRRLWVYRNLAKVLPPQLAEKVLALSQLNYRKNRLNEMVLVG